MKETITCIDCITNQPVELVMEDDAILAINKTNDVPQGDRYLGPGLVDLQVNGFAGLDFNTSPIVEKDLLKAIHKLATEGVLTFFPTVITNSDTEIRSLLEQLDQLCRNNPVIDAFVGGIHLEGPFISPVREASGAHDPAYIKAPAWELFQSFQAASGNRIKIVTLSPEWEDAPPFIEKCVTEGMIVSIGHTVATAAQIQAAVEAGATMSTHLGNAAPLALHRNNNLIYDQLANDQLTASLIADGFHLPNSFLKTALRAKHGHVVLISDTTMYAGMKPGVYTTHIGGKVVLEESGRLAMYENPQLLAGSALSLLAGVNKLLSSKLLSLSEAWSLASVAPWQLVSQDSKPRDYVLFKVLDDVVIVEKVLKEGKLLATK